jgi:hypothetical protein
MFKGGNTTALSPVVNRERQPLRANFLRVARGLGFADGWEARFDSAFLILLFQKSLEFCCLFA